MADIEDPAKAADARELRRCSFADIGAKVGADGLGWPSNVPLILRYSTAYPDPRISGGYSDKMHAVERFQRSAKDATNIIFSRLKQVGIMWAVIRQHLCFLCCSWPCCFCWGCCCRRVDEDLVQAGFSDEAFNEIFNERFGAALLRPAQPGENTASVEEALVCDMHEYLRGLEVKRGVWLEPCKIIFSQGQQGLLVEAILTEDTPCTRGATYCRKNSSEQSWLWAKRMATSCAIFTSQIKDHLVHGHLMAETFVAAAYQHLKVDHYVFQILEPLCGDIGILTRSWGIEVIAAAQGTPNPASERCVECLCNIRSFYPWFVLPFTEKAMLDAVLRAQETTQPEDWYWFDQGGLMSTDSGVKESTPWIFRENARRIFQAMLKFCRSVVENHWKDDDLLLQNWWSSLWWKKMKPVQRELNRENLAHLLATLMFNTTYRHDLAHDEWFMEHHQFLVSRLRDCKGSLSPRQYLPSRFMHLRNRVVAISLIGGNLESPLVSFRKPFSHLEAAVQALQKDLSDIIREAPQLQSMGTMTH